MPKRLIGGLTARQAETRKTPGLFADGGGLYLAVTGGGKSWIFRYQVAGRRRDMGLGSADTFSLADAREKAREARRLVAEGTDPIEARRAARAAQVFAATKAIEPIWAKKPETAGRVRGRIECILDYAAAREWRTGDNPARWRGHLENLLPKPSKVRRVEHHAALPYADMAAFMAELRGQEGTAARALEFTILTAARTGEVLGARWGEINLAERLWAIPAGRMKGGREHRVPLSPAALAIVEKMAAIRSSEFLFPGGLAGRPLSNMAMLVLLRRMGRDDLTAHGFRSSFRDWAAERTGFPAEVAEMALAHVVGDKVEAAYRRGDLFQKRRQLAESWAKFCAAPAAEVVPLRGRA